jgi:hypothetical protein
VPLLGNTQALQEVSIGFSSETPDELQWCDGAEWVTLPELAEVGGRADVNIDVVDSGAHQAPPASYARRSLSSNSTDSRV